LLTYSRLKNIVQITLARACAAWRGSKNSASQKSSPIITISYNVIFHNQHTSYLIQQHIVQKRQNEQARERERERVRESECEQELLISLFRVSTHITYTAYTKKN